MKEEETLNGGPCDGLRVLKTREPIVYTGEMGAGKLHVYHRDKDGMLRFDHTAIVDVSQRGFTA